MKILVIHTFGLGDMIMFTPSLQNISNSFPNVKIDFLILQKISVAPINEYIGVHKLYFIQNSFIQNMILLNQLRNIQYDYILHTSGTSTLKMSLIMLLLNGKNKFGECTNIRVPWYKDQVKKDENIHRVNSNLKIVALIKDMKIEKEQPFFSLKNENILCANSFLKENKKLRLIGIHPGCNEKFANKRWEIDKYKELINQFQNKLKNILIYIFIGPDERDIGIELKQSLNNIIIVDNRLDDTAAIISKMNLFITNDSGLGHIASCFNMDIVTIFSKNTHANPNKIYPYSEKSHIIDFKTIKTDDEVEVVYKYIKSLLEEI